MTPQTKDLHGFFIPLKFNVMPKPDKKEDRFFHLLSLGSFYLEFYCNGTRTSCGTGFFVRSDVGAVLVTNRHNVTGRNNYTNKPLHKLAAIPDSAVIFLPTAIGRVEYQFDLYLDDADTVPAWTENPTLGSRADVVALLICEIERNNALKEDSVFNLPDKNWHRSEVGSRVNVIGFPFGAVCDIFPVWSSGYIASEPDFNFADLPVFLVDCRSRPGQSGSPVVARFVPGDTVLHNGELFQAKKETTMLLGVYSGRINGKSDLGMVWKPHVIAETVKEAGLTGTQMRMDSRRHKYEVLPPKSYSLTGSGESPELA